MKSEEAAMRYFLRDFLSVTIERARNARDLEARAKAAGNVREELAEGGRAQAYYEVVSTFLNQAAVFGLSAEAIPELRFDPDKELLP
jgi:hypothetical protein